MQYADSVTKSFLSYGSPSMSSINTGTITEWQDPTYMGFQIRLVTSLNNDVDYDDFPHGLFCGRYTAPPAQEGGTTQGYTHNNKYSTYNYLKNRGEYKRAEYIRLFETGFSTLINECPWYFVKVSGLADAWKIDTKNNWRAKDKKITIETLESIDMKMTYLIDCYRKAVFDANWMRYAVPDHMRWFKMDIIISEVRQMKMMVIADDAADPATDPAAPGDDTKKAEAPPGPEFGLVTPNSPTPWSAATFIKFSFEQCELELNESPSFLDSVGIIGDTMSTNKFIVKPGVIHESNTYGLLGAILDDTLVWQEYGKDAAEYATKINYSDAQNEAALPSSYDINPTREDTQKAFNKEYGKTNSGSLLGKNLLAGALGFATDKINNFVNKFLLGNVYGRSPLGIFNAAQSVLSNPAAAIEGLLRKQSSPGLAAKMAKKVELTGAEINLIKVIIGNSNLSGAAAEISDPGNVGFTEAIVKTDTLGKETLTSPETQPNSPGKTILSAAPTVNSVLGSIVFESLKIAGENNTASDSLSIYKENKVELTGPEKAVATKQKTNLTAFASAGKIASKVNLTSPRVRKAVPENISLEGPVKIIDDLGTGDVEGAASNLVDGDLGFANLEGAPVITTAVGEVNLIAPNISKGRLGKVNLTSTPTPKPTLGKADL